MLLTKHCHFRVHEAHLTGVCSQIRRLCCACLVRLYAAGDEQAVVPRATSLQDYLTSKEVVNRTAPQLARVGALECLASLCLTNGTRLGPTIARTVASAIKLIGRRATTSEAHQQTAGALLGLNILISVKEMYAWMIEILP